MAGTLSEITPALLDQPRKDKTVRELVCLYVERLERSLLAGHEAEENLLRDTKTIALVDPDLASAIHEYVTDTSWTPPAATDADNLVNRILDEISSTASLSEQKRCELLLRQLGVNSAGVRKWMLEFGWVLPGRGTVASLSRTVAVAVHHPPLTPPPRQHDVTSAIRADLKEALNQPKASSAAWMLEVPLLARGYLIGLLLTRIKQVAGLPRQAKAVAMPELLYDAENIAFHDPPLAREILSFLRTAHTKQQDEPILEVSAAVTELLEDMIDADWFDVMLADLDVPTEMLQSAALIEEYLRPHRERLERRYVEEKERFDVIAALTGKERAGLQ